MEKTAKVGKIMSSFDPQNSSEKYSGSGSEVLDLQKKWFIR